MKVMLVEDSKGMRKLVNTMLQNMGIDEVLEAEHGEEAWESLRSKRFDLLMTDWNMPVMDGLELVQKVRQASEMDDLPILMFTARAGKEDVITALKAGADSYISKPFTPQELKKKIFSIMGQRSQRKINLIFKNSDRMNREEDHPLVVLGEAISDPQQLSRPDNQDIAFFLAEAVTGLGYLNSRLGDDMHIGYTLEASSSSITKRLRFFRERIKLMLLSTDLHGGGVTLARLMSINKQSGLTVLVVCDSINELPVKERYGLESLGVNMIERHRLKAEELEDIFNEYVVAAATEGPPRELPSPEEIRSRVETDIRNMVSLPILPQVYHQITALDRDPESDIQDWAACIEVDPLSRAQVIRRARSPIYGFQGEINDANKAVVLLGKNTIKELIVSGAVKRTVEGIDEEGFDVEDYWLHSVAVAVLAKIMHFPLDETKWKPEQRQDFEHFDLSDEQVGALGKMNLNERLHLTPEQDPFVGGMMHDIGKAALAQAYPGLFPIFIEDLELHDWNQPMNAAEDRIAGGANHNLVGRILGQSWKLGNDLCDLVEFHHDPGSGDRFAALITLADFIAGGLFPFPQRAQFPYAHFLQEGAEVAEGEAQEGAEKSEEEAREKPAAEPDEDVASVAALDPEQALDNFLPEGLLERLEIERNDLIALGCLLAPTVRRLVDNIRKSV